MSTIRIHTHHRLASGRIVTAGQVARAVRIARENPDRYFSETFSGQMGGSGRDVLNQFSNYCQDEINRRSGVPIRQKTPASFDRRQRKLCERARNSECKWCGQDVGKYVPDGRAFCDVGCYRAYYY